MEKLMIQVLNLTIHNFQVLSKYNLDKHKIKIKIGAKLKTIDPKISFPGPGYYEPPEN